MQDADHDLLIRIETKLDIFSSNLSDMKREVTSLWLAVDAIKEQIQNAKGFISGSKFVWAVIGALPPSIVAVIIGVNNAT